jgi:hypothetical protein
MASVPATATGARSATLTGTADLPLCRHGDTTPVREGTDGATPGTGASPGHRGQGENTMSATTVDHVRVLRWKVRLGLVGAGGCAILTLAAALSILSWDEYEIVGAVLSVAPLLAWSAWFAVRDDRAALPVYDRGLAVLLTSRERRPPAAAAAVELVRDAQGCTRVWWDGQEVASWHEDGTVTLDDPRGGPGPDRQEPPATDRVDLGCLLVDEVTLGTATFVRWLGRAWVDDLGRRWTLPGRDELLGDVARFTWPSDTGVPGLLAHLETTTKRRADALALDERRRRQAAIRARRAPGTRPGGDATPATNQRPALEQRPRPSA